MTTVAGSEHSTAPNSSARDFPDEDSMFEEPLPVSSALPISNPSVAQHSTSAHIDTFNVDTIVK
ncbi:hypothetical protein DSO57_1012250 [Entomophthora muscae]|uniref:Uncharacterized protein n=1 Tax=Entomophthora muscae TaxID=34485 RepID=A0ACC2S834_9FUNG|nr:hypothetical protein DSO57_1012250 [Entomophthora muscae]